MSPADPLAAVQVHAPDGSRAAGSQLFRLKMATLPSRGTLALWFRSKDPVRGESVRLPLLEAVGMEAWILSRDSGVLLQGIVGASTLKRELNPFQPDPYPAMGFSINVTHLKQQWYFLAWTWDRTQPESVQVYLNGVLQGNECEYSIQSGPDLPAPLERDVRMGGDDVLCGALDLQSEIIDESGLRDRFAAGSVPDYTDEGVLIPDQKFVPADVRWNKPLYKGAFVMDSEKDDWHLEGVGRLTMGQGRMMVENGDPGRPEAAQKHVVCWLKCEVPASFMLEYLVRPLRRDKGLAIVFFSARGVHGESIFDPRLAPRDGHFPQYTRGDVNSYHISYWAGKRGTSNLRKNSGFKLGAVGRDLVSSAAPGQWQQVRIYKRDGMVRLTIDTRLALAYEDDGSAFGPILNQPGWIGFRQMEETRSCEYKNVVVYPLSGTDGM